MVVAAANGFVEVGIEAGLVKGLGKEWWTVIFKDEMDNRYNASLARLTKVQTAEMATKMLEAFGLKDEAEKPGAFIKIMHQVNAARKAMGPMCSMEAILKGNPLDISVAPSGGSAWFVGTLSKDDIKIGGGVKTGFLRKLIISTECQGSLKDLTPTKDEGKLVPAETILRFAAKIYRARAALSEQKGNWTRSALAVVGLAEHERFEMDLVSLDRDVVICGAPNSAADWVKIWVGLDAIKEDDWESVNASLDDRTRCLILAIESLETEPLWDIPTASMAPAAASNYYATGHLMQDFSKGPQKYARTVVVTAGYGDWFIPSDTKPVGVPVEDNIMGNKVSLGKDNLRIWHMAVLYTAHHAVDPLRVYAGVPGPWFNMPVTLFVGHKEKGSIILRMRASDSAKLRVNSQAAPNSMGKLAHAERGFDNLAVTRSGAALITCMGDDKNCADARMAMAIVRSNRLRFHNGWEHMASKVGTPLGWNISPVEVSIFQTMVTGVPVTDDVVSKIRTSIMSRVAAIGACYLIINQPGFAKNGWIYELAKSASKLPLVQIAVAAVAAERKANENIDPWLLKSMGAVELEMVKGTTSDEKEASFKEIGVKAVKSLVKVESELIGMLDDQAVVQVGDD
jgi:uncharacterized protein YggU (UPF0235/DUF167 family)